jgi:integrative and conjugative element protein (TIGR02256 family)
MNLYISSHHLIEMLREFQHMAPKETGGIIMGYKLREIFYVTDIVGPGRKAIHDHSSFTPDNHFHQTEMARIYIESGRIHTYLGDWHTHPGQKAYLSERDKKTLHNISSFRPSRLQEPIMIILGSNPFEIKVWMYRPRGISKFLRVNIELSISSGFLGIE